MVMRPVKLHIHACFTIAVFKLPPEIMEKLHSK